MIPAILGLVAPVAAVKALTQLARAAGAALRSATAPTPLQVPPILEKAAEVSEQVSQSPVIFAYDGMSRRTKITEYTNGAVTSKKLYFWLGGSIVCERDGLQTGFPITKQYFGQGEVRGATKLYYATDHLGSVRELVDSAGTVQAEYTYSTYGERTKASGNLDSDWGYAGLWHHQASGLDLATYRAYDAANKRWISRDPLGEGVDYNLYRYCGNSPINAVDPEGLQSKKLKKLRIVINKCDLDRFNQQLGTNLTDQDIENALADRLSKDFRFNGLHLDVTYNSAPPAKDTIQAFLNFSTTSPSSSPPGAVNANNVDRGTTNHTPFGSFRGLPWSRQSEALRESINAAGQGIIRQGNPQQMNPVGVSNSPGISLGQAALDNIYNVLSSP